ncbi:MAG TPA: hypothetical protein VNX01_01125 [Bacteroidia bacterium]|jgi:hypothetical protein|nr:hypothetical protein [Bacteroidia bacterium]
MKKVILVAVVVIAGLSASCKKSYNCYCSDGTTSTTSTVKATTLSGAETLCTGKNTTTTSCGIQ